MSFKHKQARCGVSRRFVCKMSKKSGWLAGFLVACLYFWTLRQTPSFRSFLHGIRSDSKSQTDISRRMLGVSAWLYSGPAVAAPTAPDVGPTFRSLKKAPELPVATAVILLRTTQEAALDWGGPFGKPGLYQTNFNKKRSESFPAFKERFATYDLSGLFNQSQLLEKDPRSNRIYFSFLNEVQFRTLQDGIKRRGEQDRFGLNVGARLYRKILSGDVVGPRIIQGDEYDPKAPVNMSSPLSGAWPPLQPPLAQGRSAGDLAAGTRRLLDYLRGQGYCKDFSLSDLDLATDGRITFSSFVKEPANLEATSTLLRSRGFPPRFDQRILQAYFLDRGYESELEDDLSSSLDGTGKGTPSGVRTKWVLTPDADASLE